MSIDNSEIKSKYFTKNSMDESLTDFQEVKKSCKGPKTIQPKSKIKKTKKIKGQKDIRTALKGKKNELISYAKQFDDVCKEAGIDVDPEQLQLAIALSKSVQVESGTLQPSSSEDKIVKIRTTLEEYGFIVPQIKNIKKKKKKHKTQYKLLKINEAERHQVISDRYRKVLLANLGTNKSLNNTTLDAPLFFVSTNASYESMKDNSIFYVNNLVEKSTTFGTLLRDWSKIPGRPASPKLDKKTMDFKAIDCSQNELDVILSGSIKFTQNIINSKDAKIIEPKDNIGLDADDQHDTNSNDVTIISSDKLVNNIQDGAKSLHEQLTIEQSQDVYSRTAAEQHRSCSPDIFDDEISLIIDKSKSNNILSQEYKTKVFSQDNAMEITKCVNSFSQNCNKPFQLSQNLTKRRSNDFMEITDCVVTISQPILENEDEIDLTQSPNEKIDNPSPDIDVQTIDSIDIDTLQSPKHIIVRQMRIEDNKTEEASDLSLEDEIDLNQSSNEETFDFDNENEEKLNVDLIESSNSNDELPFVQLSKDKSLDDTVILDEKDYIGINGKVKCSILPDAGQEIDLTQEVMPVVSNSRLERTSNVSQSFFEEFVHDHSEGTENVTNDGKDSSDIDLTQDSDSSIGDTPINIPNSSSLGKKDDISIDYDDIHDLTQKDNTRISSENIGTNVINENRPSPNKTFKNISELNVELAEDKRISVGINDKRQSHNISTEYTSEIDVIHNIIPSSSIPSENTSEISIIDEYNSKEPHITSENNNTDKPTNDLESNLSQNSEFEISDKELNYSIHKSKHEYNNCDFGGISIMDDMTGVHSFANKSAIDNDSFLPAVDLKKNESPPGNCGVSPCKTNEIGTPENKEYIIKTCEVTPMLDYASMTTPQRNKELGKYGLKPFKRKRAIQLLTHLYNQTHPIVESYTNDDQPSPSKKQKQEPLIPQHSPIKHKSPHKEAKSAINRLASPKCVTNEDVEENVYDLTDDVPDIREVECSPDGWVFQKREKAKVHSCRVPLHIAFHNYVSSRRKLREAILKYEPVHIDVVHKDLAAYGHRYDPKDLLKFMDKKCITVKTTDNDNRNIKR